MSPDGSDMACAESSTARHPRHPGEVALLEPSPKAGVPVMPDPNLTIKETYTPCRCVTDTPTPDQACGWCQGTGFRCSKRVVRTLSPSEQGAYMQVKALIDVVRKGIGTLSDAADLFERSGHHREAAQTRAAAQAMREAAGVTEEEG